MSEGRAEEAVGIAIAMGTKLEHFDETALRRAATELVANNHDALAGEMEVGRIMLMLTKVSADHGLRAPPEISMLGKTLLSLDQVGRTLDPGFNPNQAVRESAVRLMQERMGREVSKAALLGALIDAKDFVQKLPKRVGTILDTVAANELKITVDAFDENLLMRGFEKVANRITLGLVLAALIVGASLLMRVETSFRLLGYPGLAILLFLAAAGAGIVLITSMFLADREKG